MHFRSFFIVLMTLGPIPLNADNVSSIRRGDRVLPFRSNEGSTYVERSNDSRASSPTGSAKFTKTVSSAEGANFSGTSSPTGIAKANKTSHSAGEIGSSGTSSHSSGVSSGSPMIDGSSDEHSYQRSSASKHHKSTKTSKGKSKKYNGSKSIKGDKASKAAGSKSYKSDTKSPKLLKGGKRTYSYDYFVDEGLMDSSDTTSSSSSDSTSSSSSYAKSNKSSTYGPSASLGSNSSSNSAKSNKDTVLERSGTGPSAVDTSTKSPKSQTAGTYRSSNNDNSPINGSGPSPAKGVSGHASGPSVNYSSGSSPSPSGKVSKGPSRM